MLNKELSALSNLAKDILAIVGVVGLIYAIFNFPTTFVSSQLEKALEFDATVKPTCEPLAALKLEYEDGTPIEAKLIGISIRSNTDINDITFRLNDISYIQNWAISSDGLTQTEKEKVLKHLPTGAIKEPYIFGKIPKLIGNSETTIQLQGVSKKRFDCASESPPVY